MIEIIAFTKYLFFCICCGACLAASIMFIKDGHLVYSIIFYLLGAFIWDFFERMRPPDLGLWALKGKKWLVYLFWPFYVIHYPIYLLRKLNDPKRFMVYGKTSPHEHQGFASLRQSIDIAKRMAFEEDTFIIIYDNAIFQFRRDPIRVFGKRIGVGWDPLHYIVYPNGNVERSCFFSGERPL
jgi:hypothetical protein